MRHAHEGGKTLYAGTEGGCIRCYRLPLSGEFQEYRCFSTAVLRLRLGCEDTLLFATSADGCVFMLDVKDRDPLRMPRRWGPPWWKLDRPLPIMQHALALRL